jgi:glyoxylase-like metal-dependent hydrolase (beta-lactamase superfamily II)
MYQSNIQTLDLNFQGIPNTIGVFLIHHASGGALVECGPGSTLPAIIEGLSTYNLTPKDISDVFLTHIHLDHAGSAGWWARTGATIHVHNVGAPHLLNPQKLLASANRIYGDTMDQLWGEFLPVPENKIHLLYDNDEIKINGLTIRALDTPGHANHHMSYVLDGVCFSGDVGGVHIQGIQAVRLPTVPPEFYLEKWRESVHKFKSENIRAFATTHFGIHEDSIWHLDAIERSLDEIEVWMETVMPTNPTIELVRNQYNSWMRQKSEEAGLSQAMIGAYEVAISSQMSADGIYRYWHKYRSGFGGLSDK